MREIALEVEAVFNATFEYDALLGWQVGCLFFWGGGCVVCGGVCACVGGLSGVDACVVCRCCVVGVCCACARLAGSAYI
jgi:hypothetical protein